MERGNEVVVLFARLVVQKRLALGGVHDAGVGDCAAPVGLGCQMGRQLQDGEGGPGVGVGQASDKLQSFLGHLDPQSSEAALRVDRVPAS